MSIHSDYYEEQISGLKDDVKQLEADKAMLVAFVEKVKNLESKNYLCSSITGEFVEHTDLYVEASMLLEKVKR